MRWGFGLRQVSRISLSALSFDALDSASVDLTARKRDVVPWVLFFFFAILYLPFFDAYGHRSSSSLVCRPLKNLYRAYF